MIRISARLIALATVLLVTATGLARAQVSPDVKWRTIHTEHFQVHFSPGLEEHARRAAVNAERAYVQLAAELVPPRGPLDIVIADNVDFTNGYANVFPTNRITIYTHPPSTASALRFYDEWSALVITHELAHIFHLDRARGLWRFAQYIVGRAPPVMPNLYTPSWLSEGLAVYYESRLTGSGRLIGSEHGMIARAAAIAGTQRRLDELSRTTSQYPGGQSAYAYGSLLFEHLARTRGPEGVPKFVERIALVPIPYFLNRAARRSFGVTLEAAWREFQDSLRSEVGEAADPMPGWRELTTAGRDVQHPRWLDDSTLVFAANTGRETAGAYTVDLTGRTRRLGRRTGLEPNVPLRNGGLLFAQLEYIDLHRIRSDLYIERNRRQQRLTHGERLSSPDVRRSDGTIVAVQATPGTTRLVVVTPDGDQIRAITTTSVDTQWTEPRWAPTGDRIAAVRHARDGFSEIVVLEEGWPPMVLARSRSVEASPTWSPDGSAIYFASDRSGSPQVYAVAAARDAARGQPMRLSDAATGLVEPEHAPGSPRLASVLYRADGYHLGVAPVIDPGAMPRAVEDSMLRPPLEPLAPLELDTSATTPYRPWRTLLPRYWLPTISVTEANERAYGGSTSGTDVIERHWYVAGVEYTPANGDVSGGIGYEFAGFGNPIVGASYSHDLYYSPLWMETGGPAGYFRERSQVAALSTTLIRPRFRNSMSVRLGAELERAEFSTTPDTLLEDLEGDYSTREYAAVVLSVGASNTQRPELAISPENGVAVSMTARRRWRRDGGEGSDMLIGTLRMYQAVDLGAFAHHVLALRVAGAWASQNSTSGFTIGGTSGSSFEVVPGYSIGGSSRTFGVRGFPAGARFGLQAIAGSAEFRIPLLVPARGFRLLPLFFDKVSMSTFVDAAAVGCTSRTAEERRCVDAPFSDALIASAGGELNLDAALPYDVPYRFRLGVASPFRFGGLEGIDRWSVYFTLGSSF